MVRWSLLVAAILCLAFSGYGYVSVRLPRQLSLEDLRQGRVPTEPTVVSVPGNLDKSARLYNMRPNEDIQKESERLTTESTQDGIPLLGPEGITRQAWYQFVGTRVRVSAGISESGLEDQTLSGTATDEFQLGDGPKMKSTRQQVLARLDVKEPIWVLSPEFTTNRFSELSFMQSISEDEGSAKVRQWLGKSEYAGLLQQMSDTSLGETSAEEIAQKLSLREPRDAWVLDTDSSYWPGESLAWHVYVPLADTSTPVWVQAPLKDADFLEQTLHSPKGTIVGLWLPNGRHQFSPWLKHDRPDTVPLILTRKAQIDVFQAAAWKAGPWRNAGIAGLVLLGCSAILFLLALLRRVYFRVDLPEYLKPFESYIVRESVGQRIVQVTLGLIAFVAGLFCFLVAMAGNDGTRSNNPERIALGFLMLTIALPIAWLLVGFGQMAMSRGATTILHRRSKRPILYLRSFIADARWIEHWSDLFWMVVMPGRTETAEISLGKALKGVGPLVAIGKPGEMLPPLGAARMYVQHDEWQAVVERLVKESQLVILRTGITSGFWWELEHVAKTCDPQKILIYLPPRDRIKLYPLLRERSLSILPRPLPDFCGDAFFVGFGPDWSPRLYTWKGPRFISLLRQLIVGSPGPCIRDALNAALWELKLPTGGMPLQFREWFLICLPIGLVLFLWIMIMLLMRNQ